MKIENQASFEKRLQSGISLFLGAGFSVLAEDKNGKSLPVGNKLRDELCAHFAAPEFQTLPLPAASQIFSVRSADEFSKFLTKRYSVNKFSPQYNALKKININQIFTTNIDDLVFKIFTSDPNRYVNDIMLQGLSYRDRSAIEYLALHGSVLHPNGTYAFTPIDISSAFANNPIQFQYLTKCISDQPMLFWGYGLEDAGTLQALNPHYRMGSSAKPRWIALRKPEKAAIEYFKSLGFQIIIADTEELLNYINSNITVNETNSTTLSASDFKTGRIPTVDEVPVRSLEEFFKGAAPSWHDILTSRVPITSHYHRLINEIDKDTNIIWSCPALVPPHELI